jgi:hypothetical protein
MRDSYCFSGTVRAWHVGSLMLALTSSIPTALDAQSPYESPATSPSRRQSLWASLGVGVADQGRAMSRASVWYSYDHVAVGVRASSVETLFAAAGSSITKSHDDALMLGWYPDVKHLTLVVAGGATRASGSRSAGDNRRIVEVSRPEIAPTVDAEIGFQVHRAFAAGVSGLAVHGQHTSYVALAIVVQAGWMR